MRWAIVLLTLASILQRPAVGPQRPAVGTQRPSGPSGGVAPLTLNDGLLFYYCFDGTVTTAPNANFYGNDCIGTRHLTKILDGPNSAAVPKHGTNNITNNASSTRYFQRIAADLQPAQWTLVIWGYVASGSSSVFWVQGSLVTSMSWQIYSTGGLLNVRAKDSASGIGSTLGLGLIDSNYRFVVIRYDSVADPGKLHGTSSGVFPSWGFATIPNGTMQAVDRLDVLRVGAASQSVGIDSLMMWSRYLSDAEVSQVVSGAGTVPPF